MLSLIDRGAEQLSVNGRIGPELCAALKAEGRRRVAAGDFFGFIGFVSFHAVRPG